jgi:ABC-type multidrug transport system ATPase subunit
MNATIPAIEIDHLTYAYGHAEAVHDLSLTVSPGRCYGLFAKRARIF